MCEPEGSAQAGQGAPPVRLWGPLGSPRRSQKGLCRPDRAPLPLGFAGGGLLGLHCAHGEGRPAGLSAGPVRPSPSDLTSWSRLLEGFPQPVPTPGQGSHQETVQTAPVQGGGQPCASIEAGCRAERSTRRRASSGHTGTGRPSSSTLRWRSPRLRPVSLPAPLG
ncbi:hypothetical protein H8959_018565 [Pygathrix nigripes]